MSENEIAQKLEHIEKSLKNIKKYVEDIEKSFSELKSLCEKKELIKVYIRLFYYSEDAMNKARRGAQYGYIKEQESIKKTLLMKVDLWNQLRKN